MEGCRVIDEWQCVAGRNSILFACAAMQIGLNLKSRSAAAHSVASVRVISTKVAFDAP
jgi:hypothetical protein